jgi:hypothetical protein
MYGKDSAHSIPSCETTSVQCLNANVMSVGHQGSNLKLDARLKYGQC